MQGKSLAQNNKRGRTASKKPSSRTRRMLPDENEVSGEDIKQAKLEAKQAKKQAALEAREEKRKAKLAKEPSGDGEQSINSLANISSREAEEDQQKPEKKKLNIKAVVKYTMILLFASAVLSLGVLYLLDLTGWRSNVRQKVVGYLISKEREVLVAEYDAKVEILVEQSLAEERIKLSVNQEVVTAKEMELSTREQGINAKQLEIDGLQSQLDLNIEDFENQKSDFEAEKLEFENGKIAIADLAELYASMERENAADIISSMSDRKLVVKIFSTMKKDDAAEILELMDAQKAADIISEMGD